MKIERFNMNEDNNSDFEKYNILAQKAKDLILEIWDENLQIGKMSLIAYRDIVDTVFYTIFMTIYVTIKLDNYLIFKDFFDMLYKNNIDFKFHNNEFRATVEDIDKLISDLELIINSKNYNL